MNIVTSAFDMAKAVESFVEKAKKFFYRVMLLGHRCLKCNGSLIMVPEGRCKCTLCGNEYDPTVAFQKCSACGGTPILRVRRYRCKDCGKEITSRFYFDKIIFNSAYFKAKMTESRRRKKELKECVRQMLVECRSGNLPLHPVDLGAVPGLLDALNNLTEGLDNSFALESRDEFDLKRYEKHIQAHIQDFPLSLEEIPPLSKESGRKDRIWRFIAVIFLAHACAVDIWQEGQDIMVIRHEANREGQDILGEFEEADGVEGFVGGVEA